MESLTSSKFLDDDLEPGKELFGHYGVIYRNSFMTDDDPSCIGSLSVVQYNWGKCIEWKPNEVSFVSDCQDQEWAMVNTVGHRARTLSGTEVWKGQPVKIPFTAVKGYKVLQKKTKLMIVPRDSASQHTFYFQFGNSDGITQILRSFLTSRRSRQDKKYYVIVSEKGKEGQVAKSFSDLRLVPESKEGVWTFMTNLKDRPYETTMSTFSKFSEYLLYKPEDKRPSDDEEVVGEMVSSMEASQSQREEDGYTVVEPRREPARPLPDRGPALSVLQWAAASDPDGRITHPAHVKQLIFKGGVQPSLRYEVWKFLLGYYPWDSTTTERLDMKKQKVDDYFRMKLQWKSLSPEQEARFSAFRERKTLIEKDVYRTDRTVEFYAGENNPNLPLLSDILTTYAMYNFDLGYVQGMSDLLSPILALMENEVDSFWCFVGFMDKVYRNFDEDQAGMKKQLSQLHTLLSAAEPSLAAYLDDHDSGNMFFCFRWLLVWFKREFSHEDIMTLWEVLWTGLPCSNFHLLICVAILESEKTILMERRYGFTEILKHFNELSYRLDAEVLMRKAEGVYRELESAPNITVSTKRVLGLASSGHESPTTTSSEEEPDDHSPALLTPPSLLTPSSNGETNGQVETAFETSINLHYH